ncbi:glycoside hydrolase family 16 protein [Phenylobacterium sp. J367]|uniref:glycoside hydrolase family 16 protein n=1 Tax=Phenylobacterium sp. J367 TaxID=2898435 RepID=UPI0021515B6C|nr:glycoside hydrolase family 16 protein [Phenylobacterium sp. J367]MCR5880880.1 glycoside hydrolase family 16 protein [Phenylobacterium sp. J367]
MFDGVKASRRAALAAAALAAALAACLPGGSDAVAATGPLERSPDGKRLTLTFADEFDEFRPYRLGQGVWRTTLREGPVDPQDFNVRTLKSNKELQLYVDPDMHGRRRGREDDDRPLGLNPFTARNGTLEIAARPVPRELAERLDGYRYVSGMITSQPSFRQTYGYFEMRAKLPRGKGVWPAFWLLPADLSWPPEIDVMESVGDPSKVYVTLHSNHVKAEGTEVRVSPDDFHTFSVSWTHDEVIWFVDGREVKRMATPADMHKPMYMLANIALGGDWAGQPDATTPFPARMQIDYIRAYRFAP